MTRRGLGSAHATALYLGAILGTGVLVLPALAAQAAGPASLLAWAGLLLISVPTALTFAALGARHPDAGGVATFVDRAFGGSMSAVVGWWFYFALPLGVPVGALVGGQYVADAMNGGRRETVLIAAALLVAVFACNAVGLTVAGRLQIALMVLLVVILVASIAVSLPEADLGNLVPFAPNGVTGVTAAAGLLLFSFVGWEAATHISAEFADPARDIRRVTLLTLAAITVLYLGLAVTCVLVLGPRLATSPAPLTLLLSRGLGDAAGPTIAVAAALLTFGSLNAYVAGAARLGAALARDGALPAWLASGHRPGQVPRRSLALLAVLIGSVLLVIAITGAGLDAIIAPPATCYMAVTIAGLLAGHRLLPRGASSIAAVIACAALAIAVLFTGWAMLLPGSLAAGALIYRRLASRPRQPSPEVRTP